MTTRGKRTVVRARSKTVRVKKRAKVPGPVPGSKQWATSQAKRLAAQQQERLPLSIMERAELEGLRAQAPRLDMTEREELYRLRDLVPQLTEKLFAAKSQLARCRQVMEANDPGNALDIFGPPENSQAQSASADAEGGTPPAVAEIGEEYPPEGVMP
jgi:hypothetical protein